MTPEGVFSLFSLLCHCLLPDPQNGDGSGDLRIMNVQIWHEGRYTCTAQTVVDSDTAYADLKVVGQSQHALPEMIIDAEVIYDHILVVVGFLTDK